MVAHNVGVRACASKRAKIRSRDDALRVWKDYKRDQSTSADDMNICTWRLVVVTPFTDAAVYLVFQLVTD